MVNRRHWIERIEAALGRKNVAWLRGVRRVGKTFLCRGLDGGEYLDCELPSVRRRLEDPESFLSDMRGRRVVLDEIHRLADPAELLKIAADHFPTIRVIATGSSMIEATARFKDKLTGRKADVWLTPMDSRDLEDFKGPGLRHRLLHGGLPAFYQSPDAPEREVQDWMDSYWAKDIQDLFRLEKRSSFLRFMELLFAQSGGIFEASRFAAPCEISRQTVMNYLAVLDATMVAHVIRPYSSRKATEIVAAPKVYAFDTGFACRLKGWETLRESDLGHVWEHYVLNELHAVLQLEPRYWRDKQSREVDFVLPRLGGKPLAIECKWRAVGFDPGSLLAFRKIHPAGDNLVVCHDVTKPYNRVQNGLRLRFCGLDELPRALRAGRPA